MAFLGMRGTGEWVANAEPEDWRETILYLYPNGMAPLTAMLSMLSSRQVTDPKFHWWAKRLPDQGGAITELYSDATLSTAVGATDTFAVGDVIYAKAAAAVIEEFRVGHQAMLRKTGDHRFDVQGKIVSRSLAGANSYVAIKFTQATSGTHFVDGCDNILVIGNMNPEGATMPDAIAYDPVEYSNVTQIWRTPLSITRTARKTRLRTGDQYQEAKREALELHAIEMEKSIIWGYMYEGIGENGKPERATHGIINVAKDYNPNGVDNYTLNETYDGLTWLQGGEEWLNARLALAFRYGKPEKMGLAGSDALLAINDLVRNSGQYQLNPMAVSYGIKVVEWVTPFGSIYLKTHPLFSYNTTNQNDLLIFEPEQLGFAFIDDTDFIEDPQDRKNRNNSKDATEEEFLTEGGLEWDHAELIHYLSGVGEDNPNSGG